MTEREWLFLLINAIGWALAGFALYCRIRQWKEEEAREAKKAAEAAKVAETAEAK